MDNRWLCAAAILIAGAATAPAAWAQDATDKDPGVLRASTGVNYSRGDYGEVTDTEVVSVPVAVKYRRGGFSIRVSVPYVTLTGPGSLLDTPQGRDAGFGDDTSGGGSESGDDNGGSNSSGSSSGTSGSSGSSGSGSSGYGSGGSDGGHSGGSDDSGGGSSGSSGSGGTASAGGDVLPVPVPGASGRRSGIGDVAVTVGYSLPLAGTTYLDLSGRLKVPTASRAKRLGTGKVDVTLGADLVQDVGAATVYAGARRKFIGQPTGQPLRDTWGAGAGVSYRLPGGTIVGADYDWQQSATAGRAPSSEASAFVNFGLSRTARLQVFASTGFTRNSADFAGGLTLSVRLN